MESNNNYFDEENEGYQEDEQEIHGEDEEVDQGNEEVEDDAVELEELEESSAVINEDENQIKRKIYVKKENSPNNIVETKVTTVTKNKRKNIPINTKNTNNIKNKYNLSNKEERNNHQFHTSYYSKKNINQNNNTYASSSYSKKVSNPLNTKTSVKMEDRNSNNRYEYSSYVSKIPSSQTTRLRKIKLSNGCFRCPNCNFIFNPNEQENYERRNDFIETNSYVSNYKTNTNKTPVTYAPFDTYNKRTISTTIEKKTHSNPNIYTNERGTTIFTQPIRKVQVIRKSLGANGEVLEEEIGEKDTENGRYVIRSRSRGDSRLVDEGIRNVGDNFGYYESYNTRPIKRYSHSRYY